MELNLTELHSDVDEAFIPQYCKRLKQRKKLVISGFARQNFNINKIPSDIIQLLFLLYFDINTIICGSWNTKLSNAELSFDRNNPNIFKVSESKHAYDMNQHETRNAFGNIEVKAGELQQWKMKILAQYNLPFPNRGTSVQFGIIRKDKISLDDDKSCDGFWTQEYGGFAYDANGRKLGPGRFKAGAGYSAFVTEEGQYYGQKWGFNDTITITLDLTTNYTQNGEQFGLLSFAVNDKDQGIAFDDIGIVNGEVYVLAVSIYYDTKIELLGVSPRKI